MPKKVAAVLPDLPQDEFTSDETSITLFWKQVAAMLSQGMALTDADQFPKGMLDAPVTRGELFFFLNQMAMTIGSVPWHAIALSKIMNVLGLKDEDINVHQQELILLAKEIAAQSEAEQAAAQAELDKLPKEHQA
jgi:hypothetical protein